MEFKTPNPSTRIFKRLSDIIITTNRNKYITSSEYSDRNKIEQVIRYAEPKIHHKLKTYIVWKLTSRMNKYVPRVGMVLFSIYTKIYIVYRTKIEDKFINDYITQHAIDDMFDDSNTDDNHSLDIEYEENLGDEYA